MAGTTKLMTPGGGGVNLTPASSIASDVTVNLPTAVNGATLAVNGPAFSAYQSSSQTISNNTVTKIQFQTEEFDTNNNFDSTTNYRFTPTVAGYYQLNAEVNISQSTSAFIVLYKNGTEYKRGVQTGAASSLIGFNVQALVYFNGSTDYVEVYFSQTTGASQTTNAWIAGTYFNGALVRAA